MRWALPLAACGLASLGCGVRATVLGAVDVASDADAGVLRAAPAVGALAAADCRKAFSPPLPSSCFGGSGPPPSQCLVALWPDGGSSVVTSLPTSGTRFIRALHGLRQGLAVVELGDVARVEPVVLEAAPVRAGASVTLFSRSASTTLPAVTVRDDGVQFVACDGAACELREGRLDALASTVATGVVEPSPSAPLAKSAGGAFAWASDGGVVLSPATLVSTRAGGLVDFDSEETLFLTDGSELVRRPRGGEPVTLASDLSTPRGLFVVSGFVLVVEARRVRAFPRRGGEPLVLYELPASVPGELTSPRLAGGRLVFDQVCEMLTPTVTTRGNVEVDFVRGVARWLNEDPLYPFLPGARPAGRGYRTVVASSEVVVGLVD